MEPRSDLREVRSSLLLGALGDLGVDASAVGSRELAHWDVFSQLASEASFPFVASNLEIANPTDVLRFPERYAVFSRGQLRVAFLSVLPNPAPPTSKSNAWSIRDPETAVEEVLRSLEHDPDVIVLASHLTREATRELLRAIPEIDVALLSPHPREHPRLPSPAGQPPPDRFRESRRDSRSLSPTSSLGSGPALPSCEEIGSQLLCTTGRQGQYLGHILVREGPDGVLTFEDRTVPLDSRFEDDPVWTERERKFRSELDSEKSRQKRAEREEFKRLFERWQSSRE